MTQSTEPDWLKGLEQIPLWDPPDQGDPDCLPAATKAAIQNLREYPHNWNHPNESPLPEPKQIDWLARCLAHTMADIPQPDLGWSADRTFLIYWTGKTRHIDLEIFPEERRGQLLAYEVNNFDQRAEKSIDLNSDAGWRLLAEFARKAMSHE